MWTWLLMRLGVGASEPIVPLPSPVFGLTSVFRRGGFLGRERRPGSGNVPAVLRQIGSIGSFGFLGRHRP